MSEQGYKSLQKLHIAKVNDRIREIHERFIWQAETPVEHFMLAETPEHLSLPAAKKLKYSPARKGQGRRIPAGTAWFRLRLRIPPAFKGEAVVLKFNPGAEGLIFRNGQPVQAFNHWRNDYLLTSRARGGETVELHIETAACGDVPSAPVITLLQHDVWDAYWDLLALAEMVDPAEHNIGWTGKTFGRALAEEEPRRARIIFELNKAVDVFDYGDPTTDELRSQARRVRRLLKPLYDCPANASAQTFACMGHSHIDVAWLWPLAETVRKCGRTFSNVLELMNHYPEFLFVQSQPHLYEFTRDRYPGLYKQIKQRAQKGRWIPTGGMWVEADCNVISGESLVRQFLFGTRFFKQEFGRDDRCLWLPDVFGYSAALPQILKQSGIDYFLTQKISWSQFTTFPHHSFYWEGIDGTRVLSHFLPGEDYNSTLEAFQLISAERRYRQKDRSAIQATAYGYGDGGGGPTAGHLERIRRYRNLEGMPKLTPMSPVEFFGRLEQESVDLPTWVGELYLEYHRGTYTTQGYNKRFNRKAELLLREAEMLSAINLATGANYEQKQLNAAWKLVLLNQFHDIIPGSSIDAVYRDSDQHYADIFAGADGVKDKALAVLATTVDTRGDGTPVLVFNPLSWEHQAVCGVKVKGLRSGTDYTAVSPEGACAAVQVGADGQARFIGAAPSIGHGVFHIQSGRTEAPVVRADKTGMENELLRVDFDSQGRVRQIYDKQAKREVLERDRPGNQFVLFEDKQVSCGAAWDIEIFATDKPLERDGDLLSVEVLEQGPVRGVVRFTRRMSKSLIRQDVILAAASRRVDFATSVDWGDEKDVLLKVAFPVNVRSEKARYEIQFGNVERPTHWNRPQDFAMFEVPAQKWADLSEGDYGVALLNDCKYGHDIRGNVMRLTLLRAPKSPGATADVNKTHRFTYAILPHAGDYRNGVVRAAHELNVPLTVAAARPAAGPVAPWLGRMTVSGDNVILDTVKKAEDDDSIIVRLYEAHGCRGRRTFRTSLPVARAVGCNLMEKEQKPLAIRNGKLSLSFRPFEIRTLKLTLC